MLRQAKPRTALDPWTFKRKTSWRHYHIVVAGTTYFVRCQCQHKRSLLLQVESGVSFLSAMLAEITMNHKNEISNGPSLHNVLSKRVQLLHVLTHFHIPIVANRIFCPCDKCWTNNDTANKISGDFWFLLAGMKHCLKWRVNSKTITLTMVVYNHNTRT